MLGTVAALIGPPVEAITQVVETKLARSRKSNPVLMEKNMLALDVATRYVDEKLTKQDPYQLGVVEKNDRVVLNGNQAIVAGALAGQCRFFAGFPVSPFTDTHEPIAKSLHQVGGTFQQADGRMVAPLSVC